MTEPTPSDTAAGALATTLLAGGVLLCTGLTLSLGLSGLLVGIGLTILLGVIGSGLVVGLPKLADKLERLIPPGDIPTTSQIKPGHGQSGVKETARSRTPTDAESPPTAPPSGVSDGIAWLRGRES